MCAILNKNGFKQITFDELNIGSVFETNDGYICIKCGDDENDFAFRLTTHEKIYMNDDETVTYRPGIHVTPTTSEQKWINIKNRLPKTNGKYMIRANDSNVTEMDFVLWGKDNIVTKAEFNDGYWAWFDGDYEYDITDLVTHWKPYSATLDTDLL